MEGKLKGGHYRIGKKIPGGGMGDVYHAHDTKLDRHVAFKVIKPAYLNDPEFRKRFGREARAAAAVSHPGIAHVFDYEDDGNEVYIVYEFIDGATLQKRLTEGRFAIDKVLDVGIRIADALAAVHQKKFIHRDLKPANIMLTPRPDGHDRVTILDFGLVKRVGLDLERDATAARMESLTAPGMQPGTIDYMSPEQLRSDQVDQRSDIHALGLLLHELATGINPYRGSDKASTIANIINREPAPIMQWNPDLPPELDRIIRKCLRKRCEERYQSADELLVDLSNLRRDLARQADSGQPSITLPQPEPPLTISRHLARGLFMLIQVGYLVIYSVTSYYVSRHLERLAVLGIGTEHHPLLLVSLTMCAAAVRLYFLSAVAFDYPDSARLFRRVFPAVLLLDMFWATAPLLIYQELEGLVWPAIVALVFLPFSQRTLIYSAYTPRGGRSSGVPTSKPPSAPRSTDGPGSFPPIPPASWQGR